MAMAQMQVRKTELAEIAQSKMRMLVEYEGPKRQREVDSVLAKARSDLLAKQATVAIEEAKLVKLKQFQRGSDCRPSETSTRAAGTRDPDRRVVECQAGREREKRGARRIAPKRN